MRLGPQRIELGWIAEARTRPLRRGEPLQVAAKCFSLLGAASSPAVGGHSRGTLSQVNRHRAAVTAGVIGALVVAQCNSTKHGALQGQPRVESRDRCLCSLPSGEADARRAKVRVSDWGEWVGFKKARTYILNVARVLGSDGRCRQACQQNATAAPFGGACSFADGRGRCTS